MMDPSRVMIGIVQASARGDQAAIDARADMRREGVTYQ